MRNKVTGFVAYSSSPPAIPETFRTFIVNVNKNNIINLVGWESLKNDGNLIINSIINKIKQSDLFICDITTLNHNVLFELGYAIALKKKIWILLNPNLNNTISKFKKFKLLSTVAYVSYSNSNDIIENFYSKEPYNDLNNTLFNDIIKDSILNSKEENLLYLKSKIDTESSIKLSRLIDSYDIPTLVDDPLEVPNQTLSWYLQKIYNSQGIISHFLGLDHIGNELHNAKVSFVSGIAYGLGKEMLMLAHSPYESPIDYKDILKQHETASQCVKLAENWLDKIENEFKVTNLKQKENLKKNKDRTKLQKIALGDYIAENESGNLSNYFVETAEFKEAFNSQRSIFIGRKGAGKTANLFILSKKLKSDNRNLVCVIKPVAYELNGIIRMLKQPIPKSEKGFLTESFWKYLIYTEIAKNAYELLDNKPSYYHKSQIEKDFLSFIKENKELILPKFSIRLEKVVEQLQDLHKDNSSSKQRLKISENLHSNIINKIRSQLGELLNDKNKVVILIDNLDKNWSSELDLPTFSKLLLALFDVSQNIIRDFDKSDHWRKHVNLSLIIFLRRDIFNQIINFAPEKDKISYKKIIWNDPELLLRVLEERIIYSNNSSTLNFSDDLWNKYFCNNVDGLNTKTYIVNSILPRPRDLIFFAKESFNNAINRNHTIVKEEDILDAEMEYSQHALESIIVEAGDRIENFEDLLYEFLGSNEIITDKEITQIINSVGLKDNQKQIVIDLLCELCFLGIEIKDGEYKFLYDDKQNKKYKVMARKTARQSEDEIRKYKINKPFHAYLEIKS
ncbi:P-loop ATPase, Sll1717 family [Halanaerobium sp. ST460_2HS_T2]|uniref:P-loop ATPase, Sll1717 family n=1 Tax=Halanaerobium sp. ST460_2HS_T2 TaxID=2183914 RepID=UPI000DF34650|nr:hypothetical protein [Halanaerobium sp. ST460_2HS_T2]RCW57322.1 hypothetical protein DFR80_1138 [Halanaerobium sp. ST460_2HS_T2]